MKKLGLELSLLDQIYLKLINDINNKNGKFLKNLLEAYEKCDLEPISVIEKFRVEDSSLAHSNSQSILVKYSNLQSIKKI